jgi:hypothetical protein
MTATPSHNKQTHNPDECEKKFITYPKVLAWVIGILGAGFITAYGFGVYSTELKSDITNVKQSVTNLDTRTTALEKVNQEQFKVIMANLDTLKKRAK